MRASEPLGTHHGFASQIVTEKQYVNCEIKEVRKIISQDFILSAKIALSIQRTRITISNRIYSHLVESIIRSHNDYPKLLELRKDKTADRKKTAQLVKKLLKEKLAEQDKDEKIFKEAFERTKEQNTSYKLLIEAEDEAFKKLKPELETIPIYRWLRDVKGLGLRYSVKLLYLIRDATRFPNPSKLRKYCGTAPGTKFVKGQEAHFNPELKGVMLGQIPSNFLRANSQYKRIYDEKKQYYGELHLEDLKATLLKKERKEKLTKDDWTPIRIHNYAIKAMMNRFICDLWVVWHLSEGIEPPTNIYIDNDPLHTTDPPVVPYN